MSNPAVADDATTVTDHKAPGIAGADVTAVEALGYEVEVCTDGSTWPYTLRGTRGAVYGLFRNVPNPTMLFAINERKGFGGVVKPGGYEWFTDRGGVLKPVR